MQKFYWPSRREAGCVTTDQCRYQYQDPRYQYQPVTVSINTTHGGVPAPASLVRSGTTGPQQTTTRHTMVRLGADRTGVSVTHDRHDTTAREESGRNEVPRRRGTQRNKTWNENTLTDAEYEFGLRQERGTGKRQSIQNYVFFNNNSENTCTGTEDISAAVEELQNLNLTPCLTVEKKMTKPQANKRQTPRSVKKARAPVPIQRSKSCDRGGVGATLLDNLSCISRSGRTSPEDSHSHTEEHGSVQDETSPAQSLALRLRGRLKYVEQKMKMIRSRSAERLRGVYTAGVRSEVIEVDQTRTRTVQHGTVHAYSGPVIGQARAVVDCVPSPYDREALTFARDDLIDIFDMNASGLWRGRCGSRVGHFKFVNVEILPPRRRRRSRSRSLRRMKRKPRNVAEVMKVLDMEEHLPVFVLNGYEDLTLFKDLDKEELDYLGISDEGQRDKLIAMTEVLFPDSVNNDETDDESSESGVADVHSDNSISSEPGYYSKNQK